MARCEKGSTSMTRICKILCKTTDSGTLGNFFQELVAWNNAVIGSPKTLAFHNPTLKLWDV